MEQSREGVGMILSAMNISTGHTALLFLFWVGEQMAKALAEKE